MVNSPARLGVSVSVVTMVRRKLGAPLTKAKLTCSDCERETRSKSASGGSCRSPGSPFDEYVAEIIKFSVPSSATWSLSAVADSSTSPAAKAGNARSNNRLPVLLHLTAPRLLSLLLGEPPGLQILLARPQRVQQSLRLAAVDGLLLGLCRLLLLLLRLLFLLLLLLLSGLLLLLLLFVLALRLVGLLLVLVLLRLFLLWLPHLLLLLPLLLRLQEELQIHFGVGIVGVERQRRRVGLDGVVGAAHRLDGEGQIVRRLRLELALPPLKRLPSLPRRPPPPGRL